MPYLAIILIIISFIKTINYGIFEMKQKQNKPGGIAVFITAILRTYYSMHCNYKILYNLELFSSTFW